MVKCFVIDVVYVGTLNEHHYSVSRLMLENGKNVLCEEPFCLNAKQVEELVKVITDLYISRTSCNN